RSTAAARTWLAAASSTTPPTRSTATPSPTGLKRKDRDDERRRQAGHPGGDRAIFAHLRQQGRGRVRAALRRGRDPRSHRPRRVEPDGQAVVAGRDSRVGGAAAPAQRGQSSAPLPVGDSLRRADRGDGERATMLLLTRQGAPDAAPLLHLTGIYHDRWRKTREGWRLVHRAARVDRDPGYAKHWA